MSKIKVLRSDRSLYQSMENGNFYVSLNKGEDNRWEQIKFSNKIVPDTDEIKCFLAGKVDEDDRFEYWDIISDSLVSMKTDDLKSVAVEKIIN